MRRRSRQARQGPLISTHSKFLTSYLLVFAASSLLPAPTTTLNLHIINFIWILIIACWQNVSTPLKIELVTDGILGRDTF
jgi:hypothetical protein